MDARAEHSELDDLLNEILGDQIFFNTLSDSVTNEAAGGSHRAECINSVQDGTFDYNVNSCEQCSNSKLEQNAGKNSTSYDFDEVHTSNNNSFISDFKQSVNDENSCPTSSPGQLQFRQRLKSVPDCYGNKGEDGGKQYASDSEEPLSWLEQQKIKLHTKQETSWRNRTAKQMQLMTELKSAQIQFTKKDELENDKENYKGRDNNFDRCNSPKKTENVSAKRDFIFPKQSPRTASNQDSQSAFKSEKNYFISGIERPPFTTHQTKYTFSVSPPKFSQDYSSASSYQQGKSIPPTPQRGYSSREAMKQDWQPQQGDSNMGIMTEDWPAQQGNTNIDVMMQDWQALQDNSNMDLMTQDWQLRQSSKSKEIMKRNWETTSSKDSKEQDWKLQQGNNYSETFETCQANNSREQMKQPQQAQTSMDKMKQDWESHQAGTGNYASVASTTKQDWEKQKSKNSSGAVNEDDNHNRGTLKQDLDVQQSSSINKTMKNDEFKQDMSITNKMKQEFQQKQGIFDGVHFFSNIHVVQKKW